MSRVVTRRQYQRRLAVESAALGLGYAAVLVWIGSALVGSFGYSDSYPYWPVISGLRTDTAGFLAFAVSIVTLVLSKYLQLRRRGTRPDDAPAGPAAPATRSAGVHVLQAVAETAVILGTGLVIYLSFNEVVHPWTLKLQLSHLAPWPSEGTVRVIALAFCVAGLAVRNYLRAPGAPAGQASAVREKADVTA
jgi:hypothetical protein